MNVATWLERTARRSPDREALVERGDSVTYGELNGRAAAVASCLRSLGLGAGDRVGVLLPNGITLLESLLGIWHAGMVAVPLNARSVPGEVARCLADADAGAVIHGEEFRDHAAAASGGLPGLVAFLVGAAEPGELSYTEAVALASPGEARPESVSPTAPAWLFYTSGTTGVSKGATISHRNLVNMVMAFLGDLYPMQDSDVVLHAAPLTHGSGLYALPAIARGATQVIVPPGSFSPGTVLDMVEMHGVTLIAFLAPTMVRRLVGEQRLAPRAIDSLRCVVYGGAPMYLEDVKEAIDVVGPVLAQIYGQAECPMTISRLTVDDHRRIVEQGELAALQSAGYSFAATEMRVIGEGGACCDQGDVGEIVIRGDVVVEGYWNNPEGTAEALRDGWLRTGDMGRLDADGRLYLVDRSKDLIVSGGANVYPREIEEVILRHPAVEEVAVVGIPDREWGEKVLAFVSTTESDTDDEVLGNELNALCRQHLSAYKVPREYRLLAELPKSDNGKILKRRIRDEIWAGSARKV